MDYSNVNTDVRTGWTSCSRSDFNRYYQRVTGNRGSFCLKEPRETVVHGTGCFDDEKCTPIELCPAIQTKLLCVNFLGPDHPLYSRIKREIDSAICNQHEEGYCCPGGDVYNCPMEKRERTWDSWTEWTGCYSNRNIDVQRRVRICQDCRQDEEGVQTDIKSCYVKTTTTLTPTLRTTTQRSTTTRPSQSTANDETEETQKSQQSQGSQQPATTCRKYFRDFSNSLGNTQICQKVIGKPEKSEWLKKKQSSVRPK